MRHRRGYKRLGRVKEHRMATLQAMASALFQHERIETTLGKAKALRPFAERLITRARKDSVHNRRLVARDIKDSTLLRRLFDEIGPRFADRPGGYTRIYRTVPRRGDAADMAIIELVEQGSGAASASTEPGAEAKAEESTS